MFSIIRLHFDILCPQLYIIELKYFASLGSNIMWVLDLECSGAHADAPVPTQEHGYHFCSVYKRHPITKARINVKHAYYVPRYRRQRFWRAYARSKHLRRELGEVHKEVPTYWFWGYTTIYNLNHYISTNRSLVQTPVLNYYICIITINIINIIIIINNIIIFVIVIN